MSKEHQSYVVEKGIPIPKKAGRPKSALRAALEVMEVGDSIMVRDIKPNSLAARIFEIGVATGRVFSRRIEGDANRVWRVS